MRMGDQAYRRVCVPYTAFVWGRIIGTEKWHGGWYVIQGVDGRNEIRGKREKKDPLHMRTCVLSQIQADLTEMSEIQADCA